LDSSPKQKRNLNPKRRTKRVCRSTSRALSSVDQPGRLGPTESRLMSVGRPFLCQGRSGGRPFLCHSRSGGRLGHVCVRRAHRSTERSTGVCPPVNQAVDRALSRPASMSFSLPLTSDLCAISSISFISSLRTHSSDSLFFRALSLLYSGKRHKKIF